MTAAPGDAVSARRARRFIGLPFVWGALLVGGAGGFGLGGTLAAALALGLPLGAWWPAAAQAHGRAQLLGWAGMMVLGVGLHLLPRLRGAPLAHPAWTGWAATTMAAGLALRVIVQPLAALPDAPPALRWAGLPLAALLTLAGGGLALAQLLATHRAGPPVSQQAGFRQVQPLVALSLASLAAALVLDAGLSLPAAAGGQAMLPPAANGAVLGVLLYGFLTPIALGMSARFLPLYLGLRPAPAAALRVTLALLLAGLATRLLSAALLPASGVLTGLGLLAGVWAIGQRVRTPPGVPAHLSPIEWAPTGLVRPQPPPPGRARSLPPGERAARWLIRCAYAWLVIAALLAICQALPAPPTRDLEVHALGAGFITLLILGVGGLVLPGLLGGVTPDRPLLAALVLGNAAVLLRLVPGLLGWLTMGAWPGAFGPMLIALAGLSGAGSVVCLALVVRSRARRA